MGANVTGLRSTDWWLRNSHGDVKNSIGATVNSTVVTMHGARWVSEISGGCYDCLTTALHCIPETNTKLYEM